MSADKNHSSVFDLCKLCPRLRTQCERHFKLGDINRMAQEWRNTPFLTYSLVRSCRSVDDSGSRQALIPSNWPVLSVCLCVCVSVSTENLLFRCLALSTELQHCSCRPIAGCIGVTFRQLQTTQPVSSAFEFRPSNLDSLQEESAQIRYGLSKATRCFRESKWWTIGTLCKASVTADGDSSLLLTSVICSYFVGSCCE